MTLLCYFQSGYEKELLSALGRCIFPYITASLSGSSFSARQKLRLVVVPNLRVFDGPPVEAAPVKYLVADQNGAFSAQVGVAGLPLKGVQTQVIVFADDGVPLASTLLATR